jgi:hypothetical protein
MTMMMADYIPRDKQTFLANVSLLKQTAESASNAASCT